MREVKFRLWDEHMKIMEYSPNIDCLCGPDVVGRADLNEGLSEETFMQFTGLKDKNGKEVYEGDIVLATETVAEWMEQPSPHKGTVEFENGSFVLKTKGRPLMSLGVKPVIGLEVIGNIYENKDLIK